MQRKSFPCPCRSTMLQCTATPKQDLPRKKLCLVQGYSRTAWIGEAVTSTKHQHYVYRVFQQLHLIRNRKAEELNKQQAPEEKR